MKALTMAGLILFTSSMVFAQTEASMCVSVTDVCCNDGINTGEYTIPAGQHISKTYLYHNGDEQNKVYVECWDIVNGQESFMFWAVDDICGCDEDAITDLHPIGASHHLRFKVKCKECDDQDCQEGTSTVYIYTQATTVTCPVLCQPE